MPYLSFCVNLGKGCSSKLHYCAKVSESLVISLYFSRKKGNGFSKLLKFIIQIKALKDLQKAWRSLACCNQNGTK